MDAKCLLLRHLFFQTSNHTFPLDLPGRAEATAARDRKRTTKRMLWHQEMGGSGYFGAFFTVGEAQGEVSQAIAGAGSIGGGCMALCLFRSRPTPLPLRSLPLRSLMKGAVRAERDSLVEGWRSQGAGAGEPEGGGRRRKKSEEFVGHPWLPFFQKPRLPFFSLICRHFSLHFLSPVPPSPLETLEKKNPKHKTK